MKVMTPVPASDVTGIASGVDWSAPIIHLKPWPFDDTVPMADCYFLGDNGNHGGTRTDYKAGPEFAVIGTTLDGANFFASPRGVRAAASRDGYRIAA